MSIETNPYTPPGARIAGAASPYGEARLAERGTRFVAALIDNILYGLPILPGIILISAAPEGSSEAVGFAGMVFLGGAVITLAISIYQWVLLSTEGQTLGKRWMGIRIVKIDGQPVRFASVVLVRLWVVGLIQAIPLVGPLFGLIDALFIFSSDRRCVHDLMAGTKVIEAGSQT